MEVFIQIKVTLKSNNYELLVWDTEDNALAHIVSEIKTDIQSNWDWSDATVVTTIDMIMDHIAQNSYKLALYEYNTWNKAAHARGELNCYTYYIRRKDILTAGSPTTTLPPITSSQMTAVIKQALSIASGSKPAPVVAQAPIKYGAICRGHCQQYNEYALPDQTDGKYLCHQCRMFKSVFAS